MELGVEVCMTECDEEVMDMMVAMEVLMTMVAIIIMAMETMALMTGCEMEEAWEDMAMVELVMQVQVSMVVILCT